MEAVRWLCAMLVVLGIHFSEGTEVDGEIQSRAKRNAVCGEDLYGTAGTFSLPIETCTYKNTTYPCYGKNQYCHWTIDAPVGHIVMLSADKFFLEDSHECEFDHVEIVEDDGRTIRLCDWDPVVYISTTNQLIINFYSDDTFEGAGFTFEYRTYPADTRTHCNTTIVGGSGGVLYNDETVDSSCFYAIQAPPDKVVQLSLRMIQFGSNTCEEESLLIHPGLTSQRKAEITVCSNAVAGLLSEKYNAVFIEYRNIIGSEQERFEIVYSFVDEPPPPPDPGCSRTYSNGIEWTWTSPSFKEKQHCIVVVKNRQFYGRVIQVTFETFHLEKIPGCIYDNFTVKSGSRNESSALGGPYCGKSLSGKTFVSYGNSLRMEFKTDESLSWEGVVAHIKIVKQKSCDVCQRGHVCVKKGYEKLCKKGSKCADDGYCLNGGTCVEIKNSKTCFCPDGFSGPTCSKGDGTCTINIKGPKNMKVKKGDEVLGKCEANNITSIEWLDDNEELIGDYSSKIKFGARRSGLLQIDDITDHQEGTYTCIVHTNCGTAEHSFEIEVMQQCRVDFRSRPENPLTKRTGDSVIFECSAKLAKQIHWEKADSEHGSFKTIDTTLPKYGEIKTEMNGISSSSLQIRNAQKEDEGVYRCVVESDLETDCYNYRDGELRILTVQSYLKYCGISRHDEAAHAKVSKGEDARPGEFPWQVTLRQTKKNGNTIAFCGGSLITDRHVLTAAHCITETKDFSSATVTMLFGTTDCSKSKIERHPQDYKIHPNYGKLADYDSDIAIITLSSPVELNSDIRTICLDTEDNFGKMFFKRASSRASKSGTIAGCGKIVSTFSAKRLQTSRVPFIPDCQEHVDEWNEKKPKKKHISLTDNMICAGYKDSAKTDSCQGDSGGPLIMYNNGQWFQTGIVSFGAKCGGADLVGFYTNVGKFFDWIDKETSFSKAECETCDWAYE